MKKYWKSTEELLELKNQDQVQKVSEPEFSFEGLTEDEVKSGVKANRRDFLKILGFSVGYAAVASSCEVPVRKAIPYLSKPEEIIPGVANHYASTFYDGHDFASVVIKVREGRPIKVEGNELSSITPGGTSARVQASVLSLYDGARQQYPLKGGNKTDWTTIDKEIMANLDKVAEANQKIVILSASVISPSTKKLFKGFKAKYPTAEVVYYDAISYSAMREANKLTFGQDNIASYHFDNANIIVSFNADFLGNWLSPVEFASQYAKTRDLTNGRKKLSTHYQFESYMSVTGSNADKRFPIKPSDEKVVLINLYNYIAKKSGKPTIKVNRSPVKIDNLAKELLNNPSKSLIISGTNDVYIQSIVNAINYLLSNLGSTLEFERELLTKQGNDRNFEAFVKEMNNGQVGAVLMYNVNPAYDYYNSAKFVSGLKKVGLTVAMSQKNDETSSLAQYVCPDNHFLESWDDAEPYTGFYSLTQPTIRPIFDTRQAQASIMKWAGIEGDYHSYIQKFWEENLYGKQTEFLSFNDFWNHTLQRGVFEPGSGTKESPVYDFTFFDRAGNKLGKAEQSTGIEAILYETIAIGCGNFANNPWLQELPDPISKTVWDNYVAISPNFAEELGLEQDDVVKVNGTLELPVFIQPGQPAGTVSIALGYGRTKAGKVADGIGKNANPLSQLKNNTRQYGINGVTIEKTGDTYSLVTTQTHHSMEGRHIIKETTFKEYKKDSKAGNEDHHELKDKLTTMYPAPDHPGASWGLSLDFNKCIGCNACIVACQAENNVAVIGKEEVKNRRIMHWIRLDRYYSTDGDGVNKNVESDNPEVFHQPVMCQHGDNAPCENVCPVAATPHSMEGLNTMAYNRCIGTRYCMNNCPYRVRRFNWYRYIDNDEFDYNFNDNISKMVLNPDVVVRERGVVEKCSFCVQRIQETKLIAKNEGREIRDGEVQPACVQACPTNAFVFGDKNLKGSKISKHFEDDRSYGLLEELHTLPSVVYLTKVRNTEETGNNNSERMRDEFAS